MIEIINRIQRARLQTEHFPDGKHLWATLSRPKAQREHSGHTYKMRRLLYTLDWDARRSDPEYTTGTFWAEDKLLGSVARIRPEGRECEDGRAAGSWIDAEAFSAITGKSREEVLKAWKVCWTS